MNMIFDMLKNAIPLTGELDLITERDPNGQGLTCRVENAADHSLLGFFTIRKNGNRKYGDAEIYTLHYQVKR